MGSKLNPPLRYHGGKYQLADWLAKLAPKPGSYTHRNIVCAGALGELMGTNLWPIEGVSETVNDSSLAVASFWATLSAPEYAPEFIRQASLLPLCDTLHELACETLQDLLANPLDLALAFFVACRQSRQGIPGGSYVTPTTRVRRGMNEQVAAWLSAVDGLPEVVARMRRVEVRNMDAVKFIDAYDHAKAFFYIDPPYLDETRSTGGGEYLCDSFDHEALLNRLTTLRGKFMLSGYMSDLYSRYMRQCGWVCYGKWVDKPSAGNCRASRALEENGELPGMAREWVWRNY